MCARVSRGPEKLVGLASTAQGLVSISEDMGRRECGTARRRGGVPTRLGRLRRDRRHIEDELSFWLGPIVVKMLRLHVCLGWCIHFFCCVYWRVKVANAAVSYGFSNPAERPSNSASSTCEVAPSCCARTGAARRAERG